MANTIIQLKHSTIQGAIPVSLANGELSINTFDGKLYYADPTGTIQEFSGFTGPSGLDQEVQFNDSGTLGANANFTFNKVLSTLNVGGVSLTNTYIQFGDGTRQYTANAGGGGGDPGDISPAFNQANAAFDQANAAFNKANTGSSGIFISIDSFTGTSSCTEFILSATPPNENYTIITFDGVIQNKSSYSLNNSIITFSEAPLNGTEIEVLTFSTLGTSTFLVYNSEFSGTGACTTFALSTTPNDKNYTVVSIDGVIQQKSTYSLSNNDIVFSEAPPDGSIIGVNYFKSSTFDSELVIYAANHANAAFIAANNATDTYVRNHANAAFDQANTVGDIATSAFIQANAAFEAANNATDTYVRAHANAAFDQANAAFNQANTAGITIAVDNFVGTGSCTTFTLSTTPSNENFTFVTVSGVTQGKSTYSLSGGNLIFSEAPPNGSNVEVVILTSSSASFLAYNDSFTGTGACTTFTLTSTPNNENYTFVSVTGVIQHKSTYSLSGSNIVFTEAPPDNSSIDVTYFVASTLLDSTLTVYAANHANAAFIAANNATDTYVRNHANSAFDQANAAYAQANTANNTAIAAFNQANSKNLVVVGRSTNTYIPIVGGSIIIEGRSSNTSIIIIS